MRFLVLIQRILTVGLFCLVVLSPVKAAQDNPVRIIVNSSVDHGLINLSVARSVFTRKLTRWPNDQSVNVFVLPDNHGIHRTFVKQELGLFPYQLRQIWDRMVFSGLGEAPRVVMDVEEMCQSVARTPGAIGYAPVGSECLSQGVRYVVLD